MAWEQQERALRAKRRELLRRLESGDRSERRSAGHGGGALLADSHPADLASENFERSKGDLAARTGYNRLRQVEEALKRMKRAHTGSAALRSRYRAGAPGSTPEALLRHACQEHEEREAVIAARGPGRRAAPPARRNVAGTGF